jgi:AraC-like DNA-binding protein
MKDQQREFILALCGYAAMRDVPVLQTALNCGIDIQKFVNEPDVSISRDQVAHLWREFASACDDDLFGLHFGESLQLGALGVVGEIIKSSQTIGEAITIAASLTALVTDLYSLEVVREEQYIRIQYNRTNQPADHRVAKHVLDFLLVFTIQELDGFLLRKILPLAITLAEPSNSEYERVLRCIPKAGDKVEVQLAPSYWSERVITANYDAQRELIKKLNVPASEKGNFQMKVMELLSRNSYLGMMTLEDVAANFGMTPRSVQRKLQEESTTFQQISDAVRKSLAIHYMKTGSYQLKEISYLLGYNELSAFSRAFKRWTGKAPLQYDA